MTKKGVLHWWVIFSIVIDSIAESAKRRYLSNSEADFEVFCPAGATHCTDGGEIVSSLLQPEMEICNRK